MGRKNRERIERILAGTEASISERERANSRLREKLLVCKKVPYRRPGKPRQGPYPEVLGHADR